MTASLRLVVPADFSAIEAQDLQLACVHEYAHAAVARHFGGRGLVGINREMHPGLVRKFYTGHFTLLDILSPRQTKLVWLAGSIAEVVEADPRVSPQEILSRFESEEITLSVMDRLGATGYQQQHVIESACLVGKLWDKICALTSVRTRIVHGTNVDEADIIASTLT